jgi:hypothetical protein
MTRASVSYGKIHVTQLYYNQSLQRRRGEEKCMKKYVKFFPNLIKNCNSIDPRIQRLHFIHLYTPVPSTVLHTKQAVSEYLLLNKNHVENYK